jgi:hypothetical protein
VKVLVLLMQGDDAARRRTVESIVADGFPTDAIQALEDAQPGADQLVALARPGDTFRAAHTWALEGALEARPDAVAAVGGYALVDREDRLLSLVAPLAADVEAKMLARRCRLEAAAAIVRGRVLDQRLLGLLAEPEREPVFWRELSARGPIVCERAMVADVRLDERRHGSEPALRIAQLIELLRGGAADDSRTERGACQATSATDLRRELLRKLYLEGHTVPASIELAELAGPGDAAALIADLQWTLERQAEQLAALWAGWPVQPERTTIAEPEWPEDRIPHLDLELAEARSELDRQHVIVARLVAEVGLRDARIARMSASSSNRSEPA